MLKVNALVPAEVAAHFPRGVVDAILGLVCAPSAGSEVDFTQAPYVDSAQAVVQAALLGHCSVPVAGAELALRQEQATTAIEVPLGFFDAHSQLGLGKMAAAGCVNGLAGRDWHG